MSTVTLEEGAAQTSLFRVSESRSDQPSSFEIDEIPSHGTIWYRLNSDANYIQISGPRTIIGGRSDLNVDSIEFLYTPDPDFVGDAGRLYIVEHRNLSSDRIFEREFQITSTPDAPRDIILSNYTVAENDAGAGIGILQAIDPDIGDYHSFELIGDISGKTEISAGTLRLKSGVALDYEQQTSYTVRVRAMDQTGRVIEKDIGFTVTDVNEGPPPPPPPTLGDDVLVGTANGDTISALDGDDVIRGLGGEDFLYGQNGLDVLFGGDGNDLLNGGRGADAMYGGLNDDLYYVDDIGDFVGEAVGQGIDTVSSGISYTLTAGQEIEKLRGTGAANMRLTGNEFGQTISGSSGNNLIQGMNGDDIVRGGAGNDRIDGGAGSDNLGGDAGADIFIFQAPSASTGLTHDMIVNANFDEDRLDFDVRPASLVVVNGGRLTSGNFDADIAAIVNSIFTPGGPGQAVLIDPDDGGLNQPEHRYLVIDADKDGAYTAGEDYVVELFQATGLLSPADFI